VRGCGLCGLVVWLGVVGGLGMFEECVVRRSKETGRGEMRGETKRGCCHRSLNCYRNPPFPIETKPKTKCSLSLVLTYKHINLNKVV
jgi:hypothetical protein